MHKSSITINNYDNVLTISVTDQSNTIDHVPAMVYKALVRDKIILVKDRPSFSLPTLRFGRHKRYFKQITASYDKDGKSTGVLLYGEKGTGKSLMAEELGNWMIMQDLPVVMIDTPMSAEEIRIVIRAIGPCMIYIDEFGKVYADIEQRQRMLTLFSDSSFEGTMFVITGNEGNEFSEYLFNRPQRFRYAIRYDNGIDTETLEDILKTMAVTESLHEGFHEYVKSNGHELNYDSLMCAVRESAGLTCADELADRLEILNVPAFPRTEWFIDKVEIIDLQVEEDKIRYRVHLDSRGDRLVLREEQLAEESQAHTHPPFFLNIDFGQLPKDRPHPVLLNGVNFSLEVTLKFGYNHSRPVNQHSMVKQPLGSLPEGPFNDIGRVAGEIQNRRFQPKAFNPYNRSY